MHACTVMQNLGTGSQIMPLIPFWVLATYLTLGLMKHLKCHLLASVAVVKLGQAYFCYLQPKNPNVLPPSAGRLSTVGRVNTVAPWKEFSYVSIP